MILDLQIASNAPNLPSEAELERWAGAALAGQPEEAELTIRIVDEDESQQLNRDYRGKDYATNVLSFPFEAPPGMDLPLLGDVVICAGVVAREAAEQDKALHAHWAHMVIHGCLHLLGHDHIEEAEADQMEGLEIHLLAALGYPNPYQ
ncbi:MAG: rRNA maturation RNase YbeY [Chromatiales bacterium]|nr:rRNA maturation RNase YbeY [Gammaproteobacteria bacterium]MBW6475533.1 rRNA maturation RNase YbeY [Chromatiales bacterium]